MTSELFLEIFIQRVSYEAADFKRAERVIRKDSYMS